MLRPQTDPFATPASQWSVTAWHLTAGRDLPAPPLSSSQSLLAHTALKFQEDTQERWYLKVRVEIHAIKQHCSRGRSLEKTKTSPFRLTRRCGWWRMNEAVINTVTHPGRPALSQLSDLALTPVYRSSQRPRQGSCQLGQGNRVNFAVSFSHGR